ncbi:MAG TPA: hypothetical protein VFY75_07035 [Solirubrobacterales bacterium]|nr:hypothetical protein [Solirubrobacterales bacterium]
MGYVKILGLLAVAAAALMALATTATATTITSPTGTTYTGTIHAESEVTTTLHSELLSVSCKKSTLTGSIGTHSSTGTAHGPITTLDLSECGEDVVTVLVPGTLEIHSSSTHSILTSTGAIITVHTHVFGIDCLFETNNTDIGLLTDSHHSGRTEATLDIDSALIPRTGDSMFCGPVGEWTGSYVVTTPTMLYVD